MNKPSRIRLMWKLVYTCGEEIAHDDDYSGAHRVPHNPASARRILILSVDSLVCYFFFFFSLLLINTQHSVNLI